MPPQVFSQGCLRTLCVAVRSVQEGLWKEWSRALELAAMTTGASDDLYDNMERELTVSSKHGGGRWGDMYAVRGGGSFKHATLPRCRLTATRIMFADGE